MTSVEVQDMPQDTPEALALEVAVGAQLADRPAPAAPDPAVLDWLAQAAADAIEGVTDA